MGLSMCNFEMLLLVWLIALTWAKSKEAGWFSFEKDGRLIGTALSKIPGMTLVACLRKCTKDIKCKSVSFNMLSKSCETFADSILQGDFRKELGWQSRGNYIRDSPLVSVTHFSPMFHFYTP